MGHLNVVLRGVLHPMTHSSELELSIIIEQVFTMKDVQRRPTIPAKLSSIYILR